MSQRLVGQTELKQCRAALTHPSGYSLLLYKKGANNEDTGNQRIQHTGLDVAGWS